MEVAQEEMLQPHTVQLDASRGNDDQHEHEGNYPLCDGGERKQVVDNVEDKCGGQDIAHKDGEEEWETVEAVALPQGLELIGMVLAHHDGPQEGGHDEQAIAVAVVAAFKLHNLVAVGKSACGTDGAHRRFCTAVYHADHLHARHKVHHEFCKFGFEPARSPETEAVLRGLCNGGNHRIVRVAQEHRAPAAHVIDIVVAVHVVDVAALRTGNKRRGRAYVSEGTHRAVHAARHERLGICKKFFAEGMIHG